MTRNIRFPRTTHNRFFSRSQRKKSPGRRSSCARRLRHELLEERTVLSAIGLDPGFGTDGKVIADLGLVSPTDDVALDVRVQEDGTTLVVGKAGSRFAMARYAPNGQLDPTFGDGGRVNQSFLGQLQHVAFDPSGGIIAVGNWWNDTADIPTSDVVIARYGLDGMPDEDFGLGGFVVRDFDNGEDHANELAVDGEGRIVVVGQEWPESGGSRVTVARFTADGELDSSFGVDGKTTILDNGADYLDPPQVAIDPTGRIVVATREVDWNNNESHYHLVHVHENGLVNPDFGSATHSIWWFDADEVRDLIADGEGRFLMADRHHLWRFDSAGAADPTFGNAGRIYIGFEPHRIALDSANRILLTGYDYGDFRAARFLPDGILDTSFGSGGFISADFGGSDEAFACAATSTGQVVLAGKLQLSGGYGQGDFAVAWYDTDGQLDTSYDEDGLVTTDITGDAVYNSTDLAAAPDTDGVILTGSVQLRETWDDFFAAKFNAGGDLDSAFGNGGFVTTDFRTPDTEDTPGASTRDNLRAMALDGEGRIVAVGTAFSDQESFIAIARYLPDGQLDNSFDGDGKVLAKLDTQTPWGYDYPEDVAIDAQNRIIITGTSSAADSDFVVACFTESGELDTTFSGNGWVAIDFGGDNVRSQSLSIDMEGRIVVAGESASQFALARLTDDGLVDTSFGTQGRVLTSIGGMYDSATSVTHDLDGNIVAGGMSMGFDGPTMEYRFALARYASNGDLDTSFGDSGTVTTTFLSGGQFVLNLLNRLAIDPDGNIVASGWVHRAVPIGSEFNFAVARYDNTGALDSEFGTNGTASIDFGDTIDTGLGLAIDRQGRVVVAGLQHSPDGTTKLALARFAAQNEPPTADPGGPYEAVEGSMLTLDGSGSTDDKEIVLYEWDLDFDGVTFDVDALGVAPTIYLAEDHAERAIALRVTDEEGETDIQQTTLTVTALSAADRVELIGDQVDTFVASGLLDPKDAAHLLKTLDQVLDRLESGKTTPAINKLGAFTNKVQALVNSGRLDAESGDALIGAAEAAIHSALPAAEVEAIDAAFADVGEGEPLLDSPLDDLISSGSSNGKGKGKK